MSNPQALSLLTQAEQLISQARALLEAEPTPSPISPLPNAVTDPDPNGLCWGAKFNAAERKFVRQMAVDFSTRAKLDPDWFMACFAFETMETFSTTIRPLRKDGSRISSAVGLIQWLDATAEEQGTTTDAIARMSRMEQLELAWKYFRMRIKQFGDLLTLEDVYMAIHWPSAIGKPLSATMYASGSAAYKANAGLDVNEDKIITKAEAGALVRQKLAKGYLQGNVYHGTD